MARNPWQSCREAGEPWGDWWAGIWGRAWHSEAHSLTTHLHVLATQAAHLIAHRQAGLSSLLTQICLLVPLPTCMYWMPLISPIPWYTRRAGSLRSLLHLQSVVAG